MSQIPLPLRFLTRILRMWATMPVTQQKRWRSDFVQTHPFHFRNTFNVDHYRFSKWNNPTLSDFQKNDFYRHSMVLCVWEFVPREAADSRWKVVKLRRRYLSTSYNIGMRRRSARPIDMTLQCRNMYVRSHSAIDRMPAQIDRTQWSIFIDRRCHVKAYARVHACAKLTPRIGWMSRNLASQ